MATVAGFLGYVNYREPWLGKALDYLLAAGLQGPEKSRLEIVMPEASPPAGIAVAAASRLSGYAEAFFGRPVTVTAVVLLLLIWRVRGPVLMHCAKLAANWECKMT